MSMNVCRFVAVLMEMAVDGAIVRVDVSVEAAPAPASDEPGGKCHDHDPDEDLGSLACPAGGAAVDQDERQAEGEKRRRVA